MPCRSHRATVGETYDEPVLRLKATQGTLLLFNCLVNFNIKLHFLAAPRVVQRTKRGGGDGSRTHVRIVSSPKYYMCSLQ